MSIKPYKVTLVVGDPIVIPEPWANVTPGASNAGAGAGAALAAFCFCCIALSFCSSASKRACCACAAPLNFCWAPCDVQFASERRSKYVGFLGFWHQLSMKVRPAFTMRSRKKNFMQITILYNSWVSRALEAEIRHLRGQYYLWTLSQHIRRALRMTRVNQRHGLLYVRNLHR